jgi:hypothetical protein
MIRRILVGAAIAAAALGFSATGASADQPNSVNTGQAILSGFYIADGVLNGSANRAFSEWIRSISADAQQIGNLHKLDFDAPINIQPEIVDNNNPNSDTLDNNNLDSGTVAEGTRV